MAAIFSLGHLFVQDTCTLLYNITRMVIVHNQLSEVYSHENKELGFFVLVVQQTAVPTKLLFSISLETK